VVPSRAAPPSLINTSADISPWRRALPLLRGALSRRTILATLTVAVVALAAWGAAHTIHPGALGEAFGAVSWLWVAAAAVAYAAAQVSSAMVWGVGLAAGGVPVERRHVMSAHWIGRGAAELLPAHLGEGVRFAAIRRHPEAAARGSWRIAGSMGAFKVVDGLVTFVVVAVATIAMPLPPAVAGLRWIALGTLVGLALALFAAWRLGPERLARLLPRPIRKATQGFGQGAALLTNPREATAAVGIQLVAIGGRVVSLAALLHAFGIPASAALLVFALTVMSGILPVSPGGVGVREAALVPVLVAAYGLGTEAALAFSLGVHATALFVSLIGAALALLCQRFWPPRGVQELATA
jgi:uncharacterized membrane protein YbhN (UPF0104 family)